jgi:hypothetical protein
LSKNGRELQIVRREKKLEWKIENCKWSKSTAFPVFPAFKPSPLGVRKAGKI